ncbi:ImmA/IrrE family metallo-endopeptidase, partial [Candidatus Parcubacteria bacterium]
GVLVMVSGIVGSNTHRPLDVSEFRGFALADDLAPLVFINGKDSKAGQMFTLAHELAHLWLGASGVSNSEARIVPDEKIERWCNAVAAELLAPLDAVRADLVEGEPLPETLQRLAREFKVSTLVILRRLFDAKWIDRETLEEAWKEEVKRLQRLTRAASGGDFYNTLSAHVGKRFAMAVTVSALEGHTSFTEAFRLLGVRNSRSFYEEARHLGIPV